MWALPLICWYSLLAVEAGDVIYTWERADGTTVECTDVSPVRPPFLMDARSKGIVVKLLRHRTARVP